MSSDSVSGSRAGSVHDLIRRFEGRVEDRIMPRSLPPKGKENKALALSRTPTRDALTMRSDGNSTPSDHPYSYTSTEMAVKDSLDHLESFQTATSSIWDNDSRDQFLEAPFDERRATRFFCQTDDYYEQCECRQETSIGRSNDDERTEESFASAKTSTNDCTEEEDNDELRDVRSMQRFPSDEMVPGAVESFPSDETSSTASSQRPDCQRGCVSSFDDVDGTALHFDVKNQQCSATFRTTPRTMELETSPSETTANVVIAQMSSSESGKEIFEAFEVDLSTGYIGNAHECEAANDDQGGDPTSEVAIFEREAITRGNKTASPHHLDQCPREIQETDPDHKVQLVIMAGSNKDLSVERKVREFHEGDETVATCVSSNLESQGSGCGTLLSEMTPPTFFPIYKIDSSMDSVDLDKEIEAFFSKKLSLRNCQSESDPDMLDDAAAIFYPLQHDTSLTFPSIDEDDNIEIFLAKHAPPEGASSRFIQELNKFILVASPFLKDGQRSQSNEKEIRNAAHVAGIPIKLVDRLLWQIQQQESLHCSYSGDFDLDLTPPKGQSLNCKDSQQDKAGNSGLCGLLNVIVKNRNCRYPTDTKSATHANVEDDAAFEAVPDQILLQNSSESTSINSEVDDLLTPPIGASANYIKSLNKFKTRLEPLINDFSKAPTAAETIQIWEAAQLAGVSPQTVNRLLDILERRQRTVPHLVSTLSSSLQDDEYPDIAESDEDNVVLEWIENILNKTVCEKQGGESLANHQHFEFEDFDEQSSTSESTIPSVGEDSRIEKYLAKFTAPEGASEKEIEQLNEFLNLTVPICAETPTAVEQAQIRQAAGKVGFPLEVVDQFLDQATTNHFDLGLPRNSSAATDTSDVKFCSNLSIGDDTVASNEIKDLLIRLASPRDILVDEVSSQANVPPSSAEANIPSLETGLLAMLTCGREGPDNRRVVSPGEGSTASAEGEASAQMEANSLKKGFENDNRDSLQTKMGAPRAFATPESVSQLPDHSWRSTSDQVSTLSGSILDEDVESEGLDVSLSENERETEDWKSIAQQNEHEVLKLVGEVEIRSTDSESTIGSSHQDSMIENFLAKFAPPEGASFTEIDDLNQFLRIAAPICNSNPNPVQQAQIRQAAIRMMFPLKVVDDFLEEATERSAQSLELCASRSSDHSQTSLSNSSAWISDAKFSVDDEAIANLIRRLERNVFISDPDLSNSTDGREVLGNQNSAGVGFIVPEAQCTMKGIKKRQDKHVSFQETTGKMIYDNNGEVSEKMLIPPAADTRLPPEDSTEVDYRIDHVKLLAIQLPEEPAFRNDGLVFSVAANSNDNDLLEFNRNAPLSTTASTVSTWSKYKQKAYSIEEENQDDAIAAFLQRFAALARGGHFPEASLDALKFNSPDSGSGDDGVEVDVSYGFVNKSLSPVAQGSAFLPHLQSECLAKATREHFRFEAKNIIEGDAYGEDSGIEVNGHEDSKFESELNGLISRQDWKRDSLRVMVLDAQPGLSEERETTKVQEIMPHGVEQAQRHFTFHHMSASTPNQRVDCSSCVDPVAESFKQFRSRKPSDRGIRPDRKFDGFQPTIRECGRNPLDVITTFTHCIVDPIADDPLFHRVAVSWEQFTTVQSRCASNMNHGKSDLILP